jgi:hypothetical protein
MLYSVTVRRLSGQNGPGRALSLTRGGGGGCGKWCGGQLQLGGRAARVADSATVNRKTVVLVDGIGGRNGKIPLMTVGKNISMDVV